jgi:hypothetical protein
MMTIMPHNVGSCKAETRMHFESNTFPIPGDSALPSGHAVTEYLRSSPSKCAGVCHGVASRRTPARISRSFYNVAWPYA